MHLHGSPGIPALDVSETYHKPWNGNSTERGQLPAPAYLCPWGAMIKQAPDPPRHAPARLCSAWAPITHTTVPLRSKKQSTLHLK